jgi:hypothetical protein
MKTTREELMTEKAVPEPRGYSRRCISTNSRTWSRRTHREGRINENEV